MPWESPYRGEESPVSLSPRAREIISRATMLAIGLILAYSSMRGLRGLYSMVGPPTTQPLIATSSFNHHSSLNWFPWMPWFTVIGSGLLGGTLIVAAMLPVSTMQALFERWNQPPVTGDRGLGAESFSRLWLPWWMRWWR